MQASRPREKFDDFVHSGTFSKDTNPRLVFRTELGNQHVQPQFLRDRQCEVSLTRRVPGPREPDLDEEELFQERLLIVVSSGNPLARRRKVSLRDLADRVSRCDFGRTLHRPAVAPVPAFALRMLHGALAEIVTEGQRAVPARARRASWPPAPP